MNSWKFILHTPLKCLVILEQTTSVVSGLGIFLYRMLLLFFVALKHAHFVMRAYDAHLGNFLIVEFI